MGITILNKIIILNILFGFLLFNFGQYDLNYYLPSDVDYNPKTPTPKSYFGFQPGEWYIRPDQLEGYLKELNNVSDRIIIEDYGKTFEQRPLQLIIISSPENIKNIDKIKNQHKKLSDPAVSNSISVDDVPVVVWMSYSIHGDEPSPANAVPIIAYYLAAAEGSEIENILDDTVILIASCLNPDGLASFAQWANMHRSKNISADPNTREHHQGWPTGRSNHYWFDLNRDWLSIQQPESKARVVAFQEWKPNVSTDHHETWTRSTIFLQPGLPSTNNPLTPKETYRLTNEIAKFHTEAFDKIGSLYYSKEIFDDYFYGKGSSYSDANGCIGLLFDQASSRGLKQKRVNDTLTFPFTIRNQVTATFSTLQAAVHLKTDLLNHQKNYYTTALSEANESNIKAYVFGSKTDPARSYHFLEILKTHQIQVYQLEKSINFNKKEFEPASAYIIPAMQPQYRLITSMFEKRIEFRDSVFYDVSTWNFPLSFNLPYAELTGSSFSKDLVGKEIKELEFPKGELVGDKNAYAYAMEWEGYYSPRALYKLMKAGVRVKVTTKTFKTITAEGKRNFGYGTVIIPSGMQTLSPNKVDELLEEAAIDNGVKIYSLNTGFSTEGIDLGSTNIYPLNKPEILLLVGKGTSKYEAGDAWYILDNRFDIDISMIEESLVNSIDLRKYNTIIMVKGKHNTIDTNGVKAIRDWIKQGGTLIASGSSVTWAAKNKLVEAKFNNGKSSLKNLISPQRNYVNKSRDLDAQQIGGVILQAVLDITHPIGYGYTEHEISLFRKGTIFMELSKDPYSTPLRYTDKPLLSGYISRENQNKLKNSASIVVEITGSGRVILMADNFNFRAISYGTNKLFLNSVFFGDLIK